MSFKNTCINTEDTFDLFKMIIEINYSLVFFWDCVIHTYCDNITLLPIEEL